MEFLPQWLSTEMLLSFGAGAFASGVALFYLVMQRTRKHRAAETAAE